MPSFNHKMVAKHGMNWIRNRESNNAIALTAWEYLQKLGSYDPTAVKGFYDANTARAPKCHNG